MRLTYGAGTGTLGGMETIVLRVMRLRASARMPERATPDATGLDLHASVDAPMTLGRAPRLVPCGIALEFVPGYDVQVRPRSGLTSKGVAAALGTIDADYRGELFVTMWTFGDLDAYDVRDGDRIAQLVVARQVPLEVAEVDELTASGRGDAGHGSTGR